MVSSVGSAISESICINSVKISLSGFYNCMNNGFRFHLSTALVNDQHLGGNLELITSIDNVTENVARESP